MATRKRTTRTARSRRKAPWNKSNPKPASRRRHLSTKQKASAKAKARKAGRRYPSLVDNMNAMKKKRSHKKSH